MLQSFTAFHRGSAARDGAPRLVIARRISSWLLRRWRAACRRAEQRGRFVPYY